MIATSDRLRSLTVADAMTENLVTISSNSTLSEAADVLCEFRISGAPVVDEFGRCVGVISGSDFVHSKAEELEVTNVRHLLQRGSLMEPFSIGEVRHDLVRSHMTPSVRTVGVDVPLVEAARNMVKDHVHRLIVLDQSGRPSGILTSLDLVATLIGVVEE